jgi:hypothetical protein
MRQASTRRARAAGRNRSSRIAALLAAAVPTAAAAAPDSGELIARLARRAPASIAFTEVRLSSLLAEPLVASGTLEYVDAGTLKRHVENPYRESTTIGGESVRVERDGEAPRTFALRRAPELRGLSTGLVGLLSGDASSLAEHFRITAAGDDDIWRLELVPTGERLRERLRDVLVLGSGAEPNCYVIRDNAGGASVLILGAAAPRPLPQPLALPELLEHCSAE